MNEGTQVVMSILSVAAIGAAGWYAIFKLVPVLLGVVEKLTGLPHVTKQLGEFLKLLIAVQVVVFALSELNLGSQITPYLSFLKDGASMAQSALLSMQWLIGIALWLFIGVVFVKSLSGKEVKDE